jgi:hypothetical protein
MWETTDDKSNLVSSGIYFYKLETNDIHPYKKMVLAR